MLMLTEERIAQTLTVSATTIDEATSQPEHTHTLRNDRRFYAPELDALRFGAFLMVFCRHVTTQFSAVQWQVQTSFVQAVASANQPVSNLVSTSLTSHGTAGRWGLVQGFTQSMDFGVCLFFFLSSFLITRLLLLEREATGRIAVRDFYVRRSLRIWPLYFAFLGTVVVLSYWLPVLHVERSRVLTCVLFVANWAVVLHGWASTSIQPLWSISVEEQFYVVWPWLVRSGRGAILKVSAALGVVALGTLACIGGHHGAEVTASLPNTLVQMLFFAGGAGTAVLSQPEKRRLTTWLRLTFIVVGLVVWTIASAGFHVVRTQSPGAGSLVAGYLLVLLGTFLIFTGVAGWRATRIHEWLIHMGRISYGLYVFHFVCLMLTGQALMPLLLRHLSTSTRSLLIAESVVAAVGLLLTILCAMLSYQFLERPFLKLKRHFTVVSSRPA
jgi:peptidoglycan/LPS O-acetylase OafA/YrhL